MDFAIFHQLAVALGLGLLIGLEREHRYQVANYYDFGGIRTFALISLTGALAYILSTYYAALFAVITAGFLALLIAAYVMTARNTKYQGATSEIASILVYIVGVLSAMELYVIATAIALAVLLILHFKASLHSWAKNIESRELISTSQFIIIAFIILPLLPNQYYGPYDFFNPYIVWLMVVFVSGISFASYIAIKFFGARKGICLTGFLAGFISSTALAFSFSEQSRKNRKLINPYVLAIIIASSAMFFRALIEVIVINRQLFGSLVIPMTVMGVVGVIFALIMWFKRETIPSELGRNLIAFKSPFSLWPALKFGVFFALILFLSKFAVTAIGDRGIYLTSVVSGVLDVDAITISVATLAKNGLSEKTAVLAITIAAMVNTLSKGMIFLFFGNKKVALKILGAFILMIAAGAVVLIFI